MMKRKRKQTYRVIANLDRSEIDFLDELSKDIFFTHGVHVPRNKLIEEIIDAFKRCTTINKKEIEEKLFERFKKEK